MSWTALVPLKAAGARKGRLASALPAAARDALAEAMFGHVVRVLARCPAVARVVVLTDAVPPGWSGAWLRDEGRGLNAELDAAAAALAAERLLVIHADLPDLAAEDVAALLARVPAIAPDRHGRGTNALAMAGGAIPFGFGADSFARHRALLPDAAVVRRPGLACDLDTPEDLAAAAAAALALLRAA